MPHQVNTWENVDTILESEQIQRYQTPKPIPTTNGKKTLIHDGYAWRLTRHIPGKQPQPNSRHDLEAVAAGLATLHRQLRQIDTHCIPHTYTPQQHMASVQTLLAGTQLPYTTAEQTLLRRGIEYFTKHKTPQPTSQLIHGDPSYPNLRLDQHRQIRGILDWDTTCIASPIYDLAVVAQTVLFRSNTTQTLHWLQHLTDTYHQHSEPQIDIRQLLTAVLAIKYESINTHGTRYLQGATNFDLAHSQAAKIGTTLNLLTNL